MDLLTHLQSSIPIGEKLKKINQVSKQLSESQVGEILRELKKSKDLDEVRLHVADKFQRSSEVVTFLQKGDRTIVRRAAKLPWLYKSGAPLTSADFLLQLFPSVAFTTRQKIINNLGNHLRDDKLADEIFRAIETKYGFFTALPMLQACSEELITSSIKTRKVQLPAPQVLSILKAKPEVGLHYLKEHYQGHMDVDCCLKYLADHRPQELLQLMKDRPDSFSYHMGNKKSKRILKSFPAESLELAQKKTESFAINQLQKRLSPEDYEKVFVASNSRVGETMRSSWERDQVWRYLENLPKSRQLSILRNAFKVTYNKGFLECPSMIPAELIAMLEPEERSKLLTWKLTNNDESLGYRFSKSYTSWYSNSKWFWTAFKPTSVAIPELTKLLNAEKDCSNRATLFSTLILCCIVNNDSQQLLKVLQLLTKKSRNDQTDVRRELIEGMFHASEIFEFEQDHWTCFEEVLQICQLYKELRSMSFVEELCLKLISFLLKKNRPIQEKINAFVKNILQGNANFSCKVNLLKGPENQKNLIQAYITALESAVPLGTPLTPNIFSVMEDLASEILKWNHDNQRRFGKMSISSHPILQQLCENIFSQNKDGLHCRQTLLKLLREADNFNDALLDQYLNDPDNVLLEVLGFCLKKYPQKITSNIENIILSILKVEGVSQFRPLFAIVRKLVSKKDPVLVQKMKETCKSMLDHEDPESVLVEIRNSIKVLALLESSENFMALAAKNYPGDVKIDASVPIDEVDYAKKQGIAQSLKFVKDIRLSLTAVDKFSAGDYLKLALGSLYFVCNALPEEEALSFLRTQLKEKPAVSVKKHLIRLFFSISPLEQKNNILKELWSSEKNPSIRSEILSQFYSLLRNDTSEQLWQDLRSCIESLTEEDTPSLDFLKSSEILDDCLEGLTSEFFELLLATLKRTETEELFELQVLQRLENVMSKLSTSFLESLLQDILYRAKSSNEHTFSSVLISYLLKSSSADEDVERRLEVFGKILKDLIENHWDKKQMNYQCGTTVWYCNKHLVNTIIRKICSECSESKNKTIITKVVPFTLKLLQDIQDISRTFYGRAYLELTMLVLGESTGQGEENLRLRHVGSGIGGLVDSYVGVYGAEILSFFNAIVKEFWSNVLWGSWGSNTSDHIVWVIDGILSRGSKHCMLTAIALCPTPDEKPSKEDLEIAYEKIVNTISSNSDLTVKIFYEASTTSTN